MKKYIYIALAIVCAGLFVSCEKQNPFDTQSPDDAPLILKPYNESGTGSFTYNLANPDTPLLDSVTVTPSAYTTVNWYLNDVLVYTGTRIEMCFYAGTYELKIEAVTEAGKSTYRYGSVIVNPYATDPQAPAPSGRYMVPGVEMTINGSNLDQVAALVITRDFYGNDLAATVNCTAAAGMVTFSLPAMADGTYYLFFKNATGQLYGADKVTVLNGAVALAGFEAFVPGSEWVITGVNLQNVASVKVDNTTVTELTVTADTVKLVAPAAEVGAHTLSMKNQDGSDVLFVTSAGVITEVETVVSAETTIWTGPVDLNWDADLVKVTKEDMAAVPVGSTVFVYFEVITADYHAMRITTPWWGDNASDDLVPQIDGMEGQPSPYSFEYDARRKALVDERGAMSVVGFGLSITKITYK